MNSLDDELIHVRGFLLTWLTDHADELLASWDWKRGKIVRLQNEYDQLRSHVNEARDLLKKHEAKYR